MPLPTPQPASGMRSAHPAAHPEAGFLLLGVIVLIALILIVLSVAAPRLARDLRREKEVEAVHRGNQYVRALRLYYKKLGHYPASMEQLEKSNNQRFLRQQYPDPLTGKKDWRLIPAGKALTTVKGFFGQPLAGLPGGLGSASGLASPGGSGSSPAAGGSALGPGGGLSNSSSPTGSFGTSGSNLPGGPGTSGTSGTPGNTGTSSTFGSQPATGFGGSTAPFMGIGSVRDGESIIDLNEQTTYATWEFIYDPRIEQLYAKASLFGGGPATGGSGTFGSPPGGSGFPGSPGGAPGSNNGPGGTFNSPGSTGPPGIPGSPGGPTPPPNPTPNP